jgi:predicted amino acid dehydrogenase
VDSDGIKNYKLQIISVYQPAWQLRAMCEMSNRFSIVDMRGKVIRVRYLPREALAPASFHCNKFLAVTGRCVNLVSDAH